MLNRLWKRIIGIFRKPVPEVKTGIIEGHCSRSPLDGTGNAVAMDAVSNAVARQAGRTFNISPEVAAILYRSSLNARWN